MLIKERRSRYINSKTHNVRSEKPCGLHTIYHPQRYASKACPMPPLANSHIDENAVQN